MGIEAYIQMMERDTDLILYLPLSTTMNTTTNTQLQNHTDTVASNLYYAEFTIRDYERDKSLIAQAAKEIVYSDLNNALPRK